MTRRIGLMLLVGIVCMAGGIQTADAGVLPGTDDDLTGMLILKSTGWDEEAASYDEVNDEISFRGEVLSSVGGGTYTSSSYTVVNHVDGSGFLTEHGGPTFTVLFIPFPDPA